MSKEWEAQKRWRSEEAGGGGLRKPMVADLTKGELESEGETLKGEFRIISGRKNINQNSELAQGEGRRD